MQPATAFAYLHGFASGPQSAKGRHLTETLARRGGSLRIPDLNPPTLDLLTYSSMLLAFDEFVSRHPSGTRWGLIGSSMGGLIASRWAQLNNDRVARLILLAPGFDLPSHWRTLLGPGAVEEWQATGFLDYSADDGELHRVPWELMADASTYPAFPVVDCPTLILHGFRDETVPIESSREYVGRAPRAKLVTLDDDHDLMASLDEIDRQTLQFLDPLLGTEAAATSP